MTVKDIEEIYDYNYWANQQLFSVISRLSPEEFTRDVAGSYGSVRNTMVHVLSTEWGWLSRCGGADRGASLNSTDYPTPETVIKQWSSIEAKMRAFLSQLEDKDLDTNVEYKGQGGAKRSMFLGELLRHAANHAVHHRGQVALLLRMLGYTPGNFDLLFYHADKRDVTAW